ncbi:hypothetical protein BTM25_52530 [Actinomadura rubteroloni]|uniref:Uncharacterized protein n=1 Tax=Actinomadura rubteroloni TaxID=1926885 RepID=A0A2P4UDC6_9ACTN|nr:DUF1707 domain-containing protein [Actinomadura rubteroloni]POM23047.1 hypothetical protein BTM25_52530 [Actinomadura rubteroloni]
MSTPTPQHGPVPSRDGTAPVRASGAERAAVVERLRVASVEGRLTFQELTDRTAAAYAARTRGELEGVTGDLPALGAPGAAPAPRQVVRRFTAIMGDCDARPAGRIDQDLEALAVLGDVVLDLRAAQVPSGEVAVSATAVLGDVRIIVPDGVRVEMTGRAVLGDRRVLVGDQEPDRRLPVVRVRANSILGDVRIVAGDRQDARRRPVSEPRAAD